MNLEQQVSSLEPSRRLNELGVKQDKIGLFAWVKALYVNDRREEWQLWSKWEIEYEGDMDLDQEQEWYSAFTVAELGEMLPKFYYSQQVHSDTESNRWECDAPDGMIEDTDERFLADTEADARAKMLIYLIENKLITV